MLKSIFIYQILAWFIALIVLIKEFINAILFKGNLALSFIVLIIICFSVYFIYTNFCLLFGFKKEHSKMFLEINKWVNFFQIIQLSLFGFTYYLLIGIQLCLIYTYDQQQIFEIEFNFFKTSLGINYHTSDVIIAGINFIPLIIFLFLNNRSKFFEEKQQDGNVNGNLRRLL